MCKKGLEEENEEERNGRILDDKIKMISSNWEVVDPEKRGRLGKGEQRSFINSKERQKLKRKTQNQTSLEETRMVCLPAGNPSSESKPR